MTLTGISTYSKLFRTKIAFILFIMENIPIQKYKKNNIISPHTHLGVLKIIKSLPSGFHYIPINFSPSSVTLLLIPGSTHKYFLVYCIWNLKTTTTTTKTSEVPWWFSRLSIQHCHYRCSLDCCCCRDSACHGRGQKRKNKKQNSM